MADEQTLEVLKQGSEKWNQWRKENPEREIDLTVAQLPEMSLAFYDLSKANLSGLNLMNGSLYKANLKGALLQEGYFNKTELRGVDLRYAIMNDETDLSGVRIDNTTKLGDVRGGGVDVTVVDWESVTKVGEDGTFPPELAMRANRQLANLLNLQGLNEYADRFSYRAQVCRRQYLWKKRKIGATSWSVFLDILAGYGFRPQRIFLVYLAINALFGALYYLISSDGGGGLTPLSAFVFSITSFHGRGFFPSSISINDPITDVAALQAFCGLIIEASFVATFTDRYFGK